MKLSLRKSFHKTSSKQTHQECLMPPKIGFKRPFPSSSRKLRPLPGRISSVEKTIDFVEDLINFESKEVLRSSSSDQDSVSSKSPPSSPRTLNTSDQGDNMDPPYKLEKLKILIFFVILV